MFPPFYTCIIFEYVSAYCSICINPFRPGLDGTRKLRYYDCGHVFHITCFAPLEACPFGCDIEPWTWYTSILSFDSTNKIPICSNCKEKLHKDIAISAVPARGFTCQLCIDHPDNYTLERSHHAYFNYSAAPIRVYLEFGATYDGDTSYESYVSVDEDYDMELEYESDLDLESDDSDVSDDSDDSDDDLKIAEENVIFDRNII